MSGSLAVPVQRGSCVAGNVVAPSSLLSASCLSFFCAVGCSNGPSVFLNVRHVVCPFPPYFHDILYHTFSSSPADVKRDFIF